jgi:hypothetical protein
MKSETRYLILGLAALLAIIVCVGSYVRTGGSYVFLATSLAAVPAGLVLVISAFALRKADWRVQILWCIFAMIMIRSVQLWKVGIDFRDELRFIDYSKKLFEEGQFLGYLRSYPVNIPFAAIFYGLYSLWHDIEVFEILALIVYPLLVLGYSFMAKEISKTKWYRGLDYSNLLLASVARFGRLDICHRLSCAPSEYGIGEAQATIRHGDRTVNGSGFHPFGVVCSVHSDSSLFLVCLS